MILFHFTYYFIDGNCITIALLNAVTCLMSKKKGETVITQAIEPLLTLRHKFDTNCRAMKER